MALLHWHVDDTTATIAKAETLGGSVVADTVDTPYGLAAVKDPAGAEIKLRTPNQ